jgi:hypothetical protein
MSGETEVSFLEARMLAAARERTLSKKNVL